MEIRWEKEINSKLLQAFSSFSYTSSVFNDLSNITKIDMESLKKGLKEKEMDEEHTMNTIFENCFQKLVESLIDFINAPLNRKFFST